MQNVSVILLQYQRQVPSENFRFISLKNKSYGCVKNGMLYSDSAKNYNYAINYLYDPL